MTPLLLVLLALVAEAAREAFLPTWGPRVHGWWQARHHARMVPVVPPAKLRDPEYSWWTQKRSGAEQRDHRRRWHIDLAARLAKRKR